MALRSERPWRATLWMSKAVPTAVCPWIWTLYRRHCLPCGAACAGARATTAQGHQRWCLAPCRLGVACRRLVAAATASSRRHASVPRLWRSRRRWGPVHCTRMPASRPCTPCGTQHRVSRRRDLPPVSAVPSVQPERPLLVSAAHHSRVAGCFPQTLRHRLGDLRRQSWHRHVSRSWFTSTTHAWPTRSSPTI